MNSNLVHGPEARDAPGVPQRNLLRKDLLVGRNHLLHQLLHLLQLSGAQGTLQHTGLCVSQPPQPAVGPPGNGVGSSLHLDAEVKAQALGAHVGAPLLRAGPQDGAQGPAEEVGRCVLRHAGQPLGLEPGRGGWNGTRSYYTYITYIGR